MKGNTIAKRSAPRRRPHHESDYDGGWKESLHLYLPAILAAYFPKTYAAIDCEDEPKWLNKELSRLKPSPEEKNKWVDVLVELRTASDPNGRYHAKRRLVRKLYEVGYNAEEVRSIFQVIDRMMHLRQDLMERFNQDLEEVEEELNMLYLSSLE